MSKVKCGDVCCRDKEAVEIEYCLNDPVIHINGEKSIKNLGEALLENIGRGTMNLIWDVAPPGLGFNEYQEKAASTAIYREGNEGCELFYVALGLAGEAGEFAGEVSKLIRDDRGVLTPERKQKLKSELSDNFWFIAMACTELGLTMEEVAQFNLDKLASRKERGKLNGSGGDR